VASDSLSTVVLRNWAGNVVFSTDRLHRPRSIDELQELVARTQRLHALGTGHSFNRIADSTGALVSLSDLDVAIAIDAQARTVEVGGGTRYGELGTELEEHGWALHNLGSLPHISVGGACATGTHGSGDANRCLAAAAVGVEFVSGSGELVRVGRGDSSFPGTVLALGALGIVTRLTLAIEPSFEVRQDVWLDAPLATVLERLDEVMTSGYSVSMFTTWHRPEVIDQIWVKSRTDRPIADGRDWGARPADAAQHPIAGQDAATATQQLGVPGPWNARLPHFRLEFTPSNGDEQQSEYLLPREHGRAALDALRSLDLSAALQVCEIRTVAADDLWLSPCHGRDTLGLHFTWVDDDGLVAAAVDALEAVLTPFDARPHWGKVFHTDPRPHYPQLPAFRELIDRYDPSRRFGNDYLERWVY
jgi:xylitol oxidase